ncbi:MAG: metallophosphoesterase [Phycisphaeraceae bacterium]|nr:metallophosphoesterase [Phycisphaeraceae bacterium]
MLDPIALSFPRLPGSCQGLRVAHLSDLHLHHPRRARRMINLIIDRLAPTKLDLVALTGDYMDKPGDEPLALEFFEALERRVRPRLGFHAVLGNHDSPELRRRLIAQCPWLNILDNQAKPLIEGSSMIIAGLDGDITREADPMALMASMTGLPSHTEREPGATPRRESGPPSLSTGPDPQSGREQIMPTAQRPDARRHSFILLLAHHPTWLPIAADLDIDLMLSGHTHGGQIRFPGKRAIYNSTDFPLRFSAGLLRHQNTLAVVTRGIGETALPMRIFCPRQVPMLTCNHGPLPGQFTHQVVNLQPW